jgi:hypothetical protein
MYVCIHIIFLNEWFEFRYIGLIDNSTHHGSLDSDHENIVN